ncbi:MAG TPA: acyl carrier protein [Methylophilaceae bacterium]|nr:acyl carrier protein [Methylophilaceae bacterium]HQR60918.1 acyl carrier protein [Methylophilaceae bacterium]
MSGDRQQTLQHLIQFLRTIQKPGKPVESVGESDSLVATGLIDSLAVVQIVLYLENTYGIDFAARGFDPDRLASMASILDLIEEASA